jgi:anti-sigma factor RsiW
MKTENLEALLLDRAMGELPAATAELLDEYLSSNPALAAKAKELSAVLRQAEEAMRTNGSRGLRPFPRKAIDREQRVVRWRRGLFQTLKLAACVAFGVSLGWFGKPAHHAGEAVTVASLKNQHIPAMTEKKSETTVGFWSLARFEAQRKATKPVESTGRYQLRLETPLNLQKLEEKL